MKFTLTVSMDDDAMANDPNGELASILAEQSSLVADDCRPGNSWPIFDSNGDRIGQVKVSK